MIIIFQTQNCTFTKYKNDWHCLHQTRWIYILKFMFTLDCRKTEQKYRPFECTSIMIVNDSNASFYNFLFMIFFARKVYFFNFFNLICISWKQQQFEINVQRTVSIWKWSSSIIIANTMLNFFPSLFDKIRICAEISKYKKDFD